MTINLENVFLREHSVCVGWGGEKHRNLLRDSEAELSLDLAMRVVHVVPRGGGEPFSLPLDMVRQWKTKPSGFTANGAGPVAPVKANPRARRA